MCIRNITPEVLKAFTREDLRWQYRTKKDKPFAHQSFRKWHKAIGLSKPNGGGYYPEDDLNALDDLWYAIRAMRMRISAYEEQVINQGIDLKAYIKKNWNIEYLDFVRVKTHPDLEVHEVTLRIKERLEHERQIEERNRDRGTGISNNDNDPTTR